MRMPLLTVRPLLVAVPEILRQPSAREHREGRPGLFTPQLRTIALCWVCACLPVIVVVGNLVSSTHQYLVAFAVLASAPFTSPALVHTWLAARRAPHPDDRCWWMWLVALAIMYGIGCAMLVGAFSDLRTSTLVNTMVVAVISLFVITATVLMVRARSGKRAMSVDLIEGAMSVIVVAAPAGLVWGDDVVRAEDSWYAVPAAAATVAMVFGVYWAVLLFVRLRRDGRASRLVSRIGVALAIVGLANAVGQTVQGVTGFALPAGPMLGLHGLCMSMLLLIPLSVPDKISPGLHRLAPKDQVRGAWLPAGLVLVGLPALLVTTVALRDQHAWAAPYSLGVMALLLVLAALRQLAAASETRRLYQQVERTATARRELLAQIMQCTDDDRHRVAAQLHEQAVSAYSPFVSLAQTGALSPVGAGTSVAGASALVRDELREHAESLRRLMRAVQPLEVGRPRSTSLRAPIEAYIDGLYGDQPAPRQDIDVSDDVELDWATETIVLRILQEAVRNVWRHSDASTLEIAVRADGSVVEVVVADDGVGFDPAAARLESGIGAMRSFAALGQGTLTIESAPAQGPRVVARLGVGEAPGDDQAEPVEASPDGVPRLRLLTGSGADEVAHPDVARTPPLTTTGRRPLVGES